MVDSYPITDVNIQVSEDLSNGLVDVPKIADKGSQRNEIIQSVVNNVFWNMDRDRKVFALKQLQGHMWKNGYKSGAIVGQ